VDRVYLGFHINLYISIYLCVFWSIEFTFLHIYIYIYTHNICVSIDFQATQIMLWISKVAEKLQSFPRNLSSPRQNRWKNTTHLAGSGMLPQHGAVLVVAGKTHGCVIATWCLSWCHCDFNDFFCRLLSWSSFILKVQRGRVQEISRNYHCNGIQGAFLVLVAVIAIAVLSLLVWLYRIKNTVDLRTPAAHCHQLQHTKERWIFNVGFEFPLQTGLFISISP